MKYVVEIWFADFDLLKTMTSHNLKPEIVLRRRSNCDEFKNDKNNHITVIVMLFCSMQPAKLHPRPHAAIAEFNGSVETAHTQVMTGW